MSGLNELLEAVIVANRARKAAEAAERKAKDELLTFLKLSGKSDEGVYSFPTQKGTVTVKRRTSVTILARDTLLAILGKRREEVLEPQPSKVWALLSKEPGLMASVLASGAIGLSLTEFISVTEPDEKVEADLGQAMMVESEPLENRSKREVL